jgi:TatD DNase family protein
MLSDFEKIQYIDIHTHHSPDKLSVRALQSFFIDDAPENSEQFFSAGIHPWQVESDNTRIKQKARQVFAKKKLSAIGEIGLDRRKNSSLFSQQKAVFIWQLNMAEELGLPVIIHCVKAYSDLLSVLKEVSPELPLIIHGYNENIQTAAQLLKQNVYFSFGEFLFNENSTAAKVFPEIENDKIFLETDESSYSISEIYKKAADLKGIDISKIKSIIKQNYSSVFEHRL